MPRSFSIETEIPLKKALQILYEKTDIMVLSKSMFRSPRRDKLYAGEVYDDSFKIEPIARTIKRSADGRDKIVRANRSGIQPLIEGRIIEQSGITKVDYTMSLRRSIKTLIIICFLLGAAMWALPVAEGFSAAGICAVSLCLLWFWVFLPGLLITAYKIEFSMARKKFEELLSTKKS